MANCFKESRMSFPVVLSDPVLVFPAAPTPRETKHLSDIDDQEMLRHMLCYIAVYRGGQLTGDPAPAGVIRRAVAEALVPYYPLAGRLREMEGRKLVVDCTGEGVLFVEAEAGVRLEEVEAAGVRTLFPWLKQLMSLVEGSSDVLHCPLLHIQMTRFKCGGFVLAIRFNHTMCDAVGFTHFISTVAKLAGRRGRESAGPELAVAATWARELLDARLAPKPAFAHREYDHLPAALRPTPTTAQEQDVLLHTTTLSFSSSDIAVLKKSLPPHLLRSATVFQVIAAFVWRCRSMALSLPPDQDVRLVVPLDLRRLKTLRLPAGYYGNAIIFVSSVLPAGSMCNSTLGELVEVLQQAMKNITAEYVRSVADMLVLRGRPNLTKDDGMFLLTDLRHIGIHRVDFGWGKPVYSGLTAEAASSSVSFLLGVEDRVVVPLLLPSHALERFSLEAHTWLEHLRSASRL